MFLAFADAIRNFTRALEQLVVKTAARLSKQRTVKLNLKICSSQAFFMSFRTPARLQEGHVSVVELPNYMFFATAPGRQLNHFHWPLAAAHRLLGYAGGQHSINIL